MTFEKLNLDWNFTDEKWSDYYSIGNTNIYDAAVLWEKNSYIPSTMMCVSFQLKKHLSLGKGGIILLDNAEDADILRQIRYDGRPELESPWADQDIQLFGYHYQMTYETAQIGVDKFLKQCIENLNNGHTKTIRTYLHMIYLRKEYSIEQQKLREAN